MAEIFRIHPVNPQQRLIDQVVTLIRRGGVVVYPTDSVYALGCQIGNKAALDRIKQIRRLDDKHHFTLLCRDLSELGSYAQVDNQAYRLLRSMTPGPCTFILPASKGVPRRLQHSKRKTIGLRVPQHPIAQSLLQALAEPLMNTSLQLPGDDLPLFDPEDIIDKLDKQVDAIIDGGFGGVDATSVLDLAADEPTVVRDEASVF